MNNLAKGDTVEFEGSIGVVFNSRKRDRYVGKDLIHVKFENGEVISFSKVKSDKHPSVDALKLIEQTSITAGTEAQNREAFDNWFLDLIQVAGSALLRQVLYQNKEGMFRSWMELKPWRFEEHD